MPPYKYRGLNLLLQKPNVEMMAIANHEWQYPVIKALLFLPGQPIHTIRYELMISYVRNHLAEERTIKKMAKKIEKGWFKLTPQSNFTQQRRW